jgi:Brp/Blh family beta-carotene 15,15'-monooxygenase
MGVATASTDARRGYDRLATVPAWAACAAAILLSTAALIADVSVPPAVRCLPLVASVVLFGLPHGAIDTFVPARLDDRGLGESMALVGVAYLVLGGLYAALWLVAPVIAAAAFIAITWFHWGQGDLHTLLTFVGADHLRTRPLRAATLVVRGGLPMLVPLLWFPDRYRAVVDAWVGLFGGGLSAAPLFAVETRLVAGAAFLALTVGTLAAGYRHTGATRGWRIDAGETALLWVLFATVPPLIAIGVYFCGWHAVRHVLRYTAVGGHPPTPRAFASFAREAAPLTAAALALLVGFAVVVPTVSGVPTDIEAFVALYLVFIAVLTLPHVVVVTWMDRQEGIWHD